MLILSIFTFTAVFLTVLSLCAMTGVFPDPVERRIQSLQRHQTQPLHHPKSHSIRDTFSSIGKSVAPKKTGEIHEIKQRLQYAGYYQESAFYVYWGVRMALTLGLPATAVIVLPLCGVKGGAVLWGCLFAAGIGFMSADIYLWWKKNRRQDQLFKGLPDALDLLVVCLEAGLGLDAAMQKVSEEFGISHPELSRELKMTCTSIRLGQARNEALHDLGNRTGVMDIQTLVAVLVQADRFGTGSAEALRVHAADMRTRRRQRAEEMAAKTAVKLIFPLVVFIFPAIFVVLGGPAVIKIMEVFVKP